MAAAIWEVTVVAKFASSAIAAASSFSVFRRPGAESTRLATAVSVYDSAEDKAAAISAATTLATTITAPPELSDEYFNCLVVELNQMRPALTGLGSEARISTFRLSNVAPAAILIP